jgi:hypothetical protein
MAAAAVPGDVTDPVVGEVAVDAAVVQDPVVVGDTVPGVMLAAGVGAAVRVLQPLAPVHAPPVDYPVAVNTAVV